MKIQRSGRKLFLFQVTSWCDQSAKDWWVKYGSITLMMVQISCHLDTYSESWLCDTFNCHTVDGSEILHQLRLVVYPIIYKVLYIQVGCFGISSINRTVDRSSHSANPREFYGDPSPHELPPGGPPSPSKKAWPAVLGSCAWDLHTCNLACPPYRRWTNYSFSLDNFDLRSTPPNFKVLNFQGLGWVDKRQHKIPTSNVMRACLNTDIWGAGWHVTLQGLNILSI